MEKKTLFKKYHRRIVKEGILKSLFYGLIAGSGALLISSLFSWFFGFREGIWLSIALFAVGLAATSLPLYFLKFRPTTKQIAVRVDALGLEERLLTMIELENDDSYIAARQRDDAIRAMNSVDSMLLKIVVSVALITMLVVSLVIGLVGGTAVSSLYYAGAIESGVDLIEGPEHFYTFTCQYKMGTQADSGMIVLWTDTLASTAGDPNDPLAGLEAVDTAIKVKEGEDAPAVYAIPAFGYAFAGWSDGVPDPYRQDTNVLGNIDVSARFIAIGISVEDPVGDFYMDPNGEPGNNNGNDNSGNLRLPPLRDQNEPEDPNEDDEDEKRNDDPTQQIQDGKHFYGDSFEDSYGDAQDRLGSDSNIPDELKGWISDYYGNIGTGGSDQGGGTGGTGGEGGIGGGSNTNP